MGGSGKTPHVEFIVRLLLDRNLSISIISRGYKRVTKGLISLSEKDNFMTVGDEPMQYFKKFKGKLDVIVSEDRQKAILALLQMFELAKDNKKVYNGLIELYLNLYLYLKNQ